MTGDGMGFGLSAKLRRSSTPPPPLLLWMYLCVARKIHFTHSQNKPTWRSYSYKDVSFVAHPTKLKVCARTTRPATRSMADESVSEWTTTTTTISTEKLFQKLRPNEWTQFSRSMRYYRIQEVERSGAALDEWPGFVLMNKNYFYQKKVKETPRWQWFLDENWCIPPRLFLSMNLGIWSDYCWNDNQ